MLNLESVALDPARVRDPNAWYWKVPAVRAIREEGLRLTAPVTVIVGENGTGKSTVVEAVAAAWSSRLRSAVDFWTPEPRDEDSDLHWCLRLEGEVPRPAGGCFLRAEAMHGHFSGVDSSGTSERAFGGQLNTRSHGESFLGFLESRLTERGLFILDEPESALSFTSCLRLLALIDVVVGQGSQVLLATHSPLLAAVPDASILEFGAHGIRPSEWDELELVQHWQAFLTGRDQYLRHLFTARIAPDSAPR